MNDTKLKPCPFCGGEVVLQKYYETCDGRGDRFAMVKCKCGLELSLTRDEIKQAEKDFGYKGGYYSTNKKFWNGMHRRLIEKWNARKTIERIAAQLEKLKTDEYYKSVEGNRDSGIRNNAYANAIDIVKAGGVE